MAVDISNTRTARSENDYKRSGVHTPSNVRKFKVYQHTAISIS